MRRVGFLLLRTMMACGAQAGGKHRVLFNRFLIPDVALFMADADGKNEHPLVPQTEVEYSPAVIAKGDYRNLTGNHSSAGYSLTT